MTLLTGGKYFISNAIGSIRHDGVFMVKDQVFCPFLTFLANRGQTLFDFNFHARYRILSLIRIY